VIEILLFAEDVALEHFVRALIHRIAEDLGVTVAVRPRSVLGGYGKVLQELHRFAKSPDSTPALVVAAVDANCKGVASRRRDLEARLGLGLTRWVAAVAEPHVERWMLLDGAAFKAVLGRGCSPPDQKCEKNRYKQLLREAVRSAGVEPLLGGVEFAEDIAAHYDLKRAAANDEGLRQFVDDLRRELIAVRLPG
jgi:hypothetical protein